MFQAEFWVAVAFIVFVILLVRMELHRSVSGAIDRRTARIKSELDEARRLRDEAQAVLAESERKRGQAEQEADQIVANARIEAERLIAEGRSRVEEFVARRSKMAESKIAQAEAQALADVRAAAADAAVAAAEKIMSQSVKGKVGNDLIEQGIETLKTKLN